MKGCFIQFCILIFCCLSLPVVNAQNANPAVISNIYEEGSSVGYVYWTRTNVVNATVGKWGPGVTQFGTTSTLAIDIAVNDGGIAFFDYSVQANDASSFTISVLPPPPLSNQYILSSFRPPSFGPVTTPKRYSIDLTPYRQKNITVQFTTSYPFTFRNLFFQARAIITKFQLATCQVPPLTPLTDPDAIAFENGNQINTNPSRFFLNSKLSCLSNAVANAGGGGTLTSAYRPATYQAHLREVYFAQRRLANRREPECATLKAEVQAESNRHRIFYQPARRSNHSLGRSFDYSISGLTSAQIDALANNCGLNRPLPVRDPVHFSD